MTASNSAETTCLNLKPIVQKQFDSRNTTDCTKDDSCSDADAVETKLIDIVYSNIDKKCYLAQARIGVEDMNYYEIQAIQPAEEWYDYTWDIKFQSYCLGDSAFTNSIDPDTLTGDALEKQKQESVCTYVAPRLEAELQNEIQKLK